MVSPFSITAQFSPWEFPMPANPFDPPSPLDEPSSNPYRAPSTEIESFDLPGPLLDRLASGQKLVIYSILVYFLSFVVYGVAAIIIQGRLTSSEQTNLPVTAMALILGSAIGFLTSFGMGVVGFFRMGRGLGIRLFFRILLIPLMLVPLLGIVILLMMNSRATKKLRAAGYHVGFLGASKGV